MPTDIVAAAVGSDAVGGNLHETFLGNAMALTSAASFTVIATSGTRMRIGRATALALGFGTAAARLAGRLVYVGAQASRLGGDLRPSSVIVAILLAAAVALMAAPLFNPELCELQGHETSVTTGMGYLWLQAL